MSSSLSPEQQNSLQLFQEISQIPDIDLCQDILRENHWDVESAVESFVSGRRPASSTTSSASFGAPTGDGPSNSVRQRNVNR